jgi:hypothetical protein
LVQLREGLERTIEYFEAEEFGPVHEVDVGRLRSSA